MMLLKNVDEFERLTEGMSDKKIRFLHQWGSMMELALLDGKSVTASAKESFHAINRTLPAGFTYDSAADILIPTWQYGEALNQWKENDFISDGTDNSGHVLLSDHASKRMSERLGLKKKCHLSVAKKAYYKGQKQEDIRGVFKNYIAHIAGKSDSGDGHAVFVRLYHDNIFVFKTCDAVTTTLDGYEGQVILVTVYHLSARGEQLKKLSKHDQEKAYKRVKASDIFRAQMSLQTAG